MNSVPGFTAADKARALHAMWVGLSDAQPSPDRVAAARVAGHLFAELDDRGVLDERTLALFEELLIVLAVGGKAKTPVGGRATGTVRLHRPSTPVAPTRAKRPEPMPRAR